jgi:hypothetical protein
VANIAQATVRIVGTRPFLWHHFGEDAIPLERQERTGVAGNDPEEWRKTVLFTRDRQLYVGAEYVFGCLRGGAKFTKKGRGSIQSQVAATLQVVDDFVLFDRYLPEGEPPRDPQEPVYLDVRYVRNPASRAGNVRYRVAASKGWRTQFTLLWDPTIISAGLMESVVIDAGRLVGIGDGRNIGFGRFDMESFEVTE